VLLFFGFIRDYKGLDILLKTLKTLPEEYHLIIAGEVYGNFQKYDDLISRLGISPKVSKFVRYINDDEVTNFFSAADVCVLPYKSATQSGIVGISYQYNLPVIATNVGSLKEMIEPYKTGLIVEEPDYIKLSETIIKYFKDGMNLNYPANIENYKNKYNWENLANTIINLYSQLTMNLTVK
jgi:glycosyltransferase involved in cell wall biosynthesis